jgi:hypothetical protein
VRSCGDGIRQRGPQPCRGHGERGGSVELRPLVARAAQQHELALRACAAQRVVQGLPLGRCDDVVAVAVRDEEGWRMGRDVGEQAEDTSTIGGVCHSTHTEQTRFEGEREQAGLDVAAGAGHEQVGLPEPVDDGLDPAGLLEIAADGALELVVAGGQRQERAEVRAR